MLKLHGDLIKKDLTQFFVYGSYCRPISGTWAHIENAIYIQINARFDGYYTYVCVPRELDKETIERYELRFVSRA